LFAHDVPGDPLLGVVDVNPDILDVCAQTGVPGHLSLVEPGERLPFDDATFGWPSHTRSSRTFPALRRLPRSHELARALRPGGQQTFTIQGDGVLRLCCAIRTKATRSA
jgi:hypothetical protein